MLKYLKDYSRSRVAFDLTYILILDCHKKLEERGEFRVKYMKEQYSDIEELLLPNTPKLRGKCM